MIPPTPGVSCNPRGAIQMEDWPRADLQAWEKAQRPGNPMQSPGAARSWRAATRKSAIGAYGRWLSFLAEKGWLDVHDGITEHMTAERVRDYIDHLRASCSQGTIANYLAMLVMMAKALAPAAQWSWLQDLQKQMQFGARPVRNKRTRIVPAGELLRLGLELMKKADDSIPVQGMTRQNAQDYRDGLMVALLTSRPLRQKNFVSIEIGRHLLQTNAGYRLTFTEEETKTNRSLECAIPNHLVSKLDRYLLTYRPFLLGLRETRGQSRRNTLAPANNALWVTQYGTRFSPSAQTQALKKHTLPHFGKFVNPHLFRDCVASSIANEDPEHVRITAQILGHSQFTTTENYYIQAEAGVATKHYHGQILQLRKHGRIRRSGQEGGRNTPPFRRKQMSQCASENRRLFPLLAVAEGLKMRRTHPRNGPHTP